MNTLLRLAIKALAFIYLLPLIQGISIHGSFVTAVCLAIFFSIMLWGVELLAVAVSTVLAVSTVGLALIYLIPMWILGFWLLPAFALKLVSDFMPHYMTVAGWTPAILGGLLLMVVSMITGSLVRTRSETV